jgi:hypothetical protein
MTGRVNLERDKIPGLRQRTEADIFTSAMSDCGDCRTRERFSITSVARNHSDERSLV